MVADTGGSRALVKRYDAAGRCKENVKVSALFIVCAIGTETSNALLRGGYRTLGL